MPRLTRYPDRDEEAALRQEFKEVRWVCEMCGTTNQARRVACWDCAEVREEKDEKD